MTMGIQKMNKEDLTSISNCINWGQASVRDRQQGWNFKWSSKKVCGKREKPVGLEQQRSGSLALCPSPSHPLGSQPNDEPLWLRRISFHHSLLRTCSWCLIPRYSLGALHLQCLYLGSVTHCQMLECFTTSYLVYTLQ